MSDTGIEVILDDVSFRYRKDDAPMHFDCSVAAQTVTALVGPSGSGKSTLLNLVAGFEIPESGRVLFGDDNLASTPPADRPVSMIFQENNLFAHLSVFENVALGIAPTLRVRTSDHRSIEEALRSVGLDGYGQRLPAQLSGGERQRVALARAIVRRRPVLLLDEAFASLGPAMRADMLDLVARIQKERQITTIMVTHSPDDARRIAGRTIFIADGTVAAQGNTSETLDLAVAPEVVRQYLGSHS